RAAALTRQLLAFSRKQVLTPKLLDLNALLSNLQTILRRLIREDIALELALAPRLRPIRADPSQVEQAILNLAINARDAMPEGGKLTIATETRTITDPLPEPESDVALGDQVLLTVRDTGCGMDPATKAHLFEPFFTTKGVGKGTGLGLATVYGIVK